MSRRYSVYVKGIPRDARSREIEDIFRKYGEIRDVYIPLDYNTKESRGFCYVEFQDERDAEDAIHEMNDREVMGRRVTVEWPRGGRKTSDEMKTEYGDGRDGKSGGGRGGRSRSRSRGKR